MATPTDKQGVTLTTGIRQMQAEALVSRETRALRWMTDRGLCLVTGSQTLSVWRRLAAADLPGVAELVPADGMLLVVMEPGADFPAECLASIGWAPEEAGPEGREHVIPIRFDGEDLGEVAAQLGGSTDGLIARLLGLDLHVKFLGFQPGFAYLEGLPAELHLPRRSFPRKQVPAGSVALGGGYCGIYPASGPGGWHLVGTAEYSLFDPDATPPARLQPGDRVKLVAA